MAANDWVSRYNEEAARQNTSNRSAFYGPNSGPGPGVAYKAVPTDMELFRKNFGGGFATENDYKNWQIIQQRERTLGDFVNRMASQDPTASVNASRIQGDLANYGGRLNSYLDTAAPVASQSNRFEAGLSDAESRLRALFDNPDSVQQSAAYKFRVSQGQDALQRSLGAKGLLNSGNRLMELIKYGQDMGSQEYDAQANRLSSLLGTYGQGYIGDKNANTQQYAAESNAWNQRGGLLKDLVGQANTSANQNQQIAGNDRNAWANTWVSSNNKPGQFGSGSFRWGT
jgi:hypothetical protein